MGLKTVNYKPYIAQVVTSNFDGVIEEINSVVLNTKQNLDMNLPSILIDKERMAILIENVNSVLIFNPQQAPINQLPMWNSLPPYGYPGQSPSYSTTTTHSRV